MSWVTVIWTALASVCLALSLVHLRIWLWDRRLWANLCFAITAFGVVLSSMIELTVMFTTSLETYALGLRWLNPAFSVVAFGAMGFVHFYFKTDRRWLLGAAVTLRLLAVLANFTTGQGLHLREILSIQPTLFLGENVTVLGAVVQNPWARLGQLAALTQVAYFIDASLSLWRTGSPDLRRRALIFGGALTFFVALASAYAAVFAHGLMRIPITVSLFFVGMVMTMGYELSREMWRAAQLTRELRHSQHRVETAAHAAQLGFWTMDRKSEFMWVSKETGVALGVAEGEPVNQIRFFQSIHPEDRGKVQQALAKSLVDGSKVALECRVLRADGQIGWQVLSGGVEFDAHGKPESLLGMSADITERKRAELEFQQQRDELTHLARVTTLSELSSSLAHELNQPLAIILTNAQAAQRLLAQQPPDLAEIRDILADIVSEDERAGEVIRRLRALLKLEEIRLMPLAVNPVLEDVLRIMRSDLIGRGVTVHTDLAAKLPHVVGDRVQIQQVLLNLIINAGDAMAANPPADRHLTLTTSHRDGMVRISVSDTGCGLPPDAKRVFEPFYTTKKSGLGLGLPICRSIASSHHGQLWAEKNLSADHGALFHFELPVLTEGTT